MNILHLKYAVEVERTGSITRAADNLFMGQPNLSKAIKDLEATLGFPIFRRTSKGVIATRQGEEFLNYAKNILSQIGEMEALYTKTSESRLSFSVSAPRASYITYAFTNFVSSLSYKGELDLNYKETNSLQTIKNVVEDGFNLGIIRYQTVFERYFLNLLKEKNLQYEELWEFRYLALMSTDHPLASKSELTYNDLGEYIEIAHGDLSVPSLPFTEIEKLGGSSRVKRSISVYERGSQFDLLTRITGTYIWVSPIPNDLLERNNLVQRSCSGADRRYKDVLIFGDNYENHTPEREFVDCLKKVRDGLSNCLSE